MKYRSKLRGFSLLEITVAIAVSSILVLAAAQIINLQNRSAKNSATVNDWNQFVNQVTMQVNNPQQCHQFFGAMPVPQFTFDPAKTESHALTPVGASTSTSSFIRVGQTFSSFQVSQVEVRSLGKSFIAKTYPDPIRPTQQKTYYLYRAGILFKGVKTGSATLLLGGSHLQTQQPIPLTLVVDPVDQSIFTCAENLSFQSSTPSTSAAQLSCRTVSEFKIKAIALCAPDEVLTGGGGGCDVANCYGGCGAFESQAIENGWQVSCGATFKSFSVAICCKKGLK